MKDSIIPSRDRKGAVLAAYEPASPKRRIKFPATRIALALALCSAAARAGGQPGRADTSSRRHMARLSRRLLRPASQLRSRRSRPSNVEESGPRVDLSDAPERSLKARPSWPTAFSTSPSRTTSGRSMPAPATRSGTTSIRRTKACISVRGRLHVERVDLFHDARRARGLPQREGRQGRWNIDGGRCNQGLLDAACLR